MEWATATREGHELAKGAYIDICGAKVRIRRVQQCKNYTRIYDDHGASWVILPRETVRIYWEA